MLPAGFLHIRGWVRSADSVFDALAQLEWARPSIRMFGKSIQIPRLVAAFGDARYSYSGLTHEPAPWHPIIAAIRSELETRTGATYNTCLANYYRNGRDSIGWHADDERELGEQPTIASVSLGAARTFAIRHRVRRFERHDIRLESGDLVVMSGRAQLDYEHAVLKTKEAAARINLTFRRVMK